MKTKSRWILSIIMLLFCVATFVGTTFAWFTDSVTSSNNIIASGTLDVEMHWATTLDSTEWKNVETDSTPIFNNKNWEPGYTEVRYIKVKNAGSLAFRYSLAVIPNGRVGELAEVIDVYYVVNPTENLTSASVSALPSVGTLKDMIGTHKGGGVLLPKNEVKAGFYSGEVIVAVALRLPTTVGNFYQGSTVGDSFDIQIVATQYGYETDSFDPEYDGGAQFPSFGDEKCATAPVTPTADGKVPAGGVSLTNSEDKISATVPEGVLLESGANALTLTVNKLDESNSNVILDETEVLLPLDVHIEGVSASNTVPMTVLLEEVAPIGLNIGNFKLYHVENGSTGIMTAKATTADLTDHNDFVYDPATGNITLYIASFSEVAVVADTENKWNGDFDYSWYTNAVALAENESVTEYSIANADQLAAFGAIVGGMVDGQTQDSFKNKTVKLLANINLGDAENENNPNIIFYPIGYNSNDGKYEKTGVAVSTGFYTFEGTFDGNGHTVANFYQNTWEMKGDHNWYDATLQYYRDGMGLFGKVYGGTVKNLTVANFNSDGEIATTGVIAAYADGATFENIAILNCNPRVYNIGNGGIVGCVGWYAKEAGLKTTFENITVDNSNKISALWGSYDVACGGIVGQYYPTSGQTSAGTPKNGGVHFENCHVSAQMDVYNDVCANYQYYAYRYTGMLIGSVRENETVDGHVYPKMDGITAKDCTVHFGDWNDYYYCELVANSLASYTHDHQMSRLEQVASVDVENKKVTSLKGVTTDIPTSGRVNYVVVKAKDANDMWIHGDGTNYATCYHFVDGTIWNHEDAGTETVNGETVLKEDKQLIYREFNQLFTGYGWGVTSKGLTDFEGVENMDIKAGDKEESVEKFESKFTSQDFVYRVGNQNAVNIGSLFKATDREEINNSGVWVTIESETVSGTFTPNTSDWTKGTIQFTGTGVVKLTIQDYNFCTTTELIVEVIDAVNATGATSATKNNVVLLNDCGFSSLEVSGGYTLYGNGFTMTCASDSAALDMGYAFVTLNSGTLDNVQIVCPNFDYAVLYKSNMTEAGNRSETTDKTRYFNVKSGVMASGNSKILNSRISGARAAVNVSGGNVVIDNSRIELGAVASVLVGAANSLTLRDTTLVQKPTASTYDSSKTLMGFSVLLVCDANGNAAPVTLEGTLVQNAWIDENDKQYVPSAGQSIISTVLAKTEYLHDIDGDDTNESLNLGFAYMPESLTSKVNTTTITDNRTDKDTVPYDYAEVSILSGKTYVYSYKNTNETVDSFKTESNYTPNKQSDIITVSYSDTQEGLTSGKSYSEDGWVYELNVDLDKASGYALDFSKLSMAVNGVTVTDFKVNGSDKPTSPVAVTAGGTTYVLTATVNGKEHTATYKVTGTETSKESPSLVASNYEAGLCVASSYGGTWSGAAPALEGIQIKYWSVAEKQYKTITLSDYTPTTAGKQNGTNTTWTYSPDNRDFTLTLTGGQVHNGNKVNAMPVVCDGKLYFVAASSNGLVNTGNSARTIPVAYSFKDNNNGEELTFSHTWSVAENQDEQYKYSDFCNGTLTKLEAGSSSGGGTCVTPDTLITLADGTQKRVDELDGTEELLVLNLETGKLDSAPIMFIDSDPESNYEVVKLVFADGTEVKTIYEHGFWDYNLNEYVYVRADNYADYVGHYFAKQNGNELEKVMLENVVVETEVTMAYSPVTKGHLCYFVNGMLSMPGGVAGLFNIFEVDSETMTYDAEAMQRDIETYGLFTYEELNAIVELPESMFNEAGGAYLKISIAKGRMTLDELIAMVERYKKFF